jgi:O-antigen/teichoic acid export membrane protein
MSNQLIKNISSWSLPDLIDLPAKVIVYFLLVDLLDKEIFGMLNLAMMVFSYQGLAQFGVVDWLMYELPKKYTLNLNMSNVLTGSFTFTMVNQFVLLLILVIAVLSLIESRFLGFAIIAYFLHSFFYNSYLHQTLLLRYQYKFKELLRIRIIFSILRFCIEVTSILLVGIYGFLVVEAIIFLIPIFLLSPYIKLRPNFGSLYKKYFFYLKKGRAFFAIILLSTVLGNIDRWFIVYSFGLEDFATYSIGIFMVTAILIFPGKVLSIFTQYLKEFYVNIDNDNANVRRNYSINNMLLGIFSIILIFISTGKFLIFNYLPKYAELVPLVNAFLLLSISRYGVSLTSNVLYLLNKRKVVAKMQIVITMIYILSLVYLDYLGPTMLEILWNINFIMLINIAANLTFIFLSKGVSINKEPVKFAILFLITYVYYFLIDFYGETLTSLYVFLLLIVFFFGFKQTWQDVMAVSNKQYHSTD